MSPSGLIINDEMLLIISVVIFELRLLAKQPYLQKKGGYCNSARLLKNIVMLTI